MTGTGIAGAQDYQTATKRRPSCFVCGKEFEASAAARAAPGRGVIEACSKVCAADPRFSGGFVLVPREPTEAMLIAAMSRPIDNDEPLYIGVWRAMVAAAEREVENGR